MPADPGKDVVVIHQFPKGKVLHSASPFVIKLMTFLKIAGIDYVCDHKNWKGPKGKTPWITINGKNVADSQLAIEYLMKALDKNINSHLSPEEAAVERVFQVTIDDRFYWCGAIDRFIFNDPLNFQKIGTMPVPKFLEPLFVKRVVAPTIKKQSHAHGLGRHTDEEIKKIALGDMKAFSDYLGNKPYLMGEKPTVVDCTLFGFMAATLWTLPESDFLTAALKKDYPNLVSYTERIKEKYWSTWDECTFTSEKR